MWELCYFLYPYHKFNNLIEKEDLQNNFLNCADSCEDKTCVSKCQRDFYLNIDSKLSNLFLPNLSMWDILLIQGLIRFQDIKSFLSFDSWNTKNCYCLRLGRCKIRMNNVMFLKVSNQICSINRSKSAGKILYRALITTIHIKIVLVTQIVLKDVKTVITGHVMIPVRTKMEILRLKKLLLFSWFCLKILSI